MNRPNTYARMYVRMYTMWKVVSTKSKLQIEIFLSKKNFCSRVLLKEVAIVWRCPLIEASLCTQVQMTCTAHTVPTSALLVLLVFRPFPAPDGLPT